LTCDHTAAVLLHPDGGLKAIPEASRVVMALTKVTPESDQTARRLAGILEHDPRVDRAITLSAVEL
jgi:hypothetical protein